MLKLPSPSLREKNIYFITETATMLQYNLMENQHHPSLKKRLLKKGSLTHFQWEGRYFYGIKARFPSAGSGWGAGCSRVRVKKSSARPLLPPAAFCSLHPGDFLPPGGKAANFCTGLLQLGFQMRYSISSKISCLTAEWFYELSWLGLSGVQIRLS